MRLNFSVTPSGRRDVPPGTWVVIPVYNEHAVIADVLNELLRTFDRVVCVDDGSSDDSAALIARTGAHLVRHPVNLGQGAALQTGVEYVLRDPAAQLVITYDADGQHRVEDAVTMVRLLAQQDVDIVFGSRFLSGTTELPRLKRLVLKLAVRYMNATSQLRLTDAHNGLRVFNRRVAAALDIQQGGMAHASEIVTTVARNGFRYTEAPVQILYTDYSRAKGQSVLNSVNILFDLMFR